MFFRVHGAPPCGGGVAIFFSFEGSQDQGGQPLLVGNHIKDDEKHIVIPQLQWIYFTEWLIQFYCYKHSDTIGQYTIQIINIVIPILMPIRLLYHLLYPLLYHYHDPLLYPQLFPDITLTNQSWLRGTTLALFFTAVSGGVYEDDRPDGGRMEEP